MNVCDICKTTFKTKSSLNLHKTRAKYCKKMQSTNCKYCNILLLNKDYNTHINICIEYYKSIYKECESNKLIIEIQNKNLQQQNEDLKKENKELLDKIEDERNTFQEQLNTITLKLIEKPSNINNYSNNSKNTNNTKIDIFNNLTPLKDSDFIESASKLTLDHVRNGVEGYAKFSIENPLKDKIICVDYPRKKISYKDENENRIEEYRFEKILPKIFSGIKDVNKELLEIVMDEIDSKYNNFSNLMDDYVEGSKEEKEYSDLLDNHYNKMMEYTNIMCDCRNISNGKINNKLAKEIIELILNKIPRKS